MAKPPPISFQERHWNAEVARRRPDLVAQESGSLEQMIERYYELVGSTIVAVGTVLTDRARVLRHLIDQASEAESERDPASEAGRHLTSQVGRHGSWTEAQAERLAALIRSHAGARPEIMPTGDGTIVVNFGPRRGNGAYVLDPEGGSRWITVGRHAA
jgi:hypothetical protein